LKYRKGFKGGFFGFEMKNYVQFFDFDKLRDYFANNLNSDKKGRRLYLNQDVICKNIFVSIIPVLSEFDYVNRLSSISFTQGDYVNVDGIGIWEEFRIRFKKSISLKDGKRIQKGKYRVMVKCQRDKTPIVKTFVRKLGRWKKSKLPDGLPLEKILKSM